MPRAFNVEVFRGVINTGVTYYSDPAHDKLLGSADVLALQAIVEATPGATTVTAQYQTSNRASPLVAEWSNPPNFTAAQPSPASASDVPKAALTGSSLLDPMGSEGRVAVSCSAQTGVLVRVLVCGRVRGRGAR
ncbi:MAG: hypothetical protein HY909_25150 [Deltaproteobacteria bacterium]|nr:hypothetical protein [Deltaproteobacteria bacterium]